MNWDLPVLDVTIRLLAASALGGVLGLERELSHKPAGLRTHMMVSLGAAAFTAVTMALFQSVAEVMERTQADPLRIVEGVIGGIGFLGAGTIIRSRGSVEGITTAASIWVVGAVGLACGLGYYAEAGIMVVLALVVIGGVGRLARRFERDEDGTDVP